MERGKIKIIDKDKLEVVTIIYNEETTDRFTFDEILKFIELKRKETK